MTPHQARLKVREYKLEARHVRSRGVSGVCHRVELGYSDKAAGFLAFAFGTGDTRNEATVAAIELFEQRGLAFLQQHPDWEHEYFGVTDEEGVKPISLPML